MKRVAFVAACGAAVVLPVVIFGLPVGADFNNHFRHALPLFDSLRAGDFDPPWLAETNNGYGDARFRFYPPALYYLLCAGRSLTGDWFAGSVLVFALLSAAGALGVYYWSLRLTSPRVAALAGALYVVAPYHLNEFYQASFLAEYAACAALPWAFAFAERLLRRGSRSKPSDVAGLGAAYSCLVLSNLPLAVIGSLALGGYACLLAARAPKVKTALTFAAGLSLGLMASAFYWVRMLSELSWIQAGSTEGRAYYDYRGNFLFTTSSLTTNNVWYANLLALVTLGFFVPSIILLVRSRRVGAPAHGSVGPATVAARAALFPARQRHTLSPFFAHRLAAPALLFAFAFLMTTGLSRPVWALVPKLDRVQFPYRWLSVVSLAGCPLLAAGLARWAVLARRRALRPLHLLVCLPFALALYHVGSQIVWDSRFVPRDEFTSLLTEIRGAVSFADWMPVGAKGVTGLERMEGEVAAPGREVSVVESSPRTRTFRIAPGDAAQVRVRAYYYPLWRAHDAGGSGGAGPPLLTHAAADGALVVSVPASPVERTITVEFIEPARTTYSRLASALGVALMVGIGLTGRGRPRRWRMLLASRFHGRRQQAGGSHSESDRQTRST